MKIYIVRHGEVSHNARKVYSNENEDLNEFGIIQAKELKRTIEDLDYDIIISSPLIRAKHTSMIINAKNKNILIDNRLEERNPGDLNGKPISYTNREEYWNYYTRIKYGTSENIQDFFKRLGKYEKRVKNSMIIGGGKISYYLAKKINDVGVSCKIIEKNIKKIQKNENKDL